MAPIFKFMTGAHQYRLEAKDRDEALRIAFTELNPTEDAKTVIRQTLHSEDDSRRILAPGGTADDDETEVRDPPKKKRSPDGG